MDVIAQRAAGRWRSAGALCLLAMCSLLAFANVWRGEFVFDDLALRQGVAEQVRTGGWRDLFQHDLYRAENGARSGFYRPLAALSLCVDQVLFGDAPVGYHATNFGLHVLTVWLVFGAGLAFGVVRPVAFAAALLFAVHPVHSEAVAWISGRFDVLCAAFYLLAVWLFAMSHQHRSKVVYVLALVAGAAALLSKEMAVTLPAALLLLDLLGLSRGRQPQRQAPGGFWAAGAPRAFLRAVPFAVLVGAYVVLRLSRSDLALGRPGEETVPLVERSLTAGRALFYYLGLLVWPRAPNALPLVPPITSPFDAWFLGAVAIIGGCVGAAQRWRHTRPELTFGLVFFLLSLIPISNLVALYPAAGIRFPVAERYMYLPSWAFAFGLAVLVWDCTRHAATRRHAVFGAVIVALAGAGIARSLARNPAWKSNDALFQSSVRADPRSPWAHVMLGALRRTQGRPDDARRSFRTALEHDPGSYSALFELGNVEMSEHRYAAAVEWYRRALDRVPAARDARLGLGNALLQMGQMQEAEREYARLRRQHPDDSGVLVNHGQALAKLGQMSAARETFERAAQIDRRCKEAYYNLAYEAMLRRDLDAAEAYCRQAVTVDGRYKEAWVLLGNLRDRRGDHAGAADQFEKAVAIDSTDAVALTNLGVAELNRGDAVRAVRWLQAALRRGPSVVAFVNLAEAQKRTGNTAAAEAAFREAARMDPMLPAARRGLGLLLAERPGQEAAARRLLESLPEGDSGPDSEVEAALTRLRRRR